MSNASKGNYYKLKSKKWLENKGFQVGFLERMMWIPTKDRKVIPVKKDQFGSDLLAVSDEQVIFVQVKLNSTNVAVGRKEFYKYKFPDFIDKWIIVWQERVREPEIIEV